ncbi:MAG: holo-ACP synthase [Victivallales bacterium]|nr:holo-ACP synthase [Victivallales bacterium]
MIRGVGTDIVEIARLRQSIERYADAFLAHVFTPDEQSSAPHSGDARLAYFAGRWAAKEAVAKALGTGFCEKCAWLELRITNLPSGAPVVELSGTAAVTAAERGIHTIHLSISHEKHYAVAVAIAEDLKP